MYSIIYNNYTGTVKTKEYTRLIGSRTPTHTSTYQAKTLMKCMDEISLSMSC